MSISLRKLGRAEMAALVVETLAAHGIEFSTAPLAIGHEQIGSERVATKDTAMGTIRLLNPTDTIKDRLLWWYLDGDRQCWEQALDIARHHKIVWSDLKKWHRGEGYAGRSTEFREVLK